MSISESCLNCSSKSSWSQDESSAVLLWASAYALRCSSVRSSSLMIGTFSIPSSLAARSRPWPSTIVSCHMPMGSLNPNSRIDSAMDFTSAFPWVLAFFSQGWMESMLTYSILSFVSVAIKKYLSFLITFAIGFVQCINHENESCYNLQETSRESLGDL